MGSHIFLTEAQVAQKCAEKVPAFEYAGNYTGQADNGRVDLKCRTCGTIINRSLISVRHSNVKCKVCEHRRSEENKRRTAEAKRKEQEKREEARREKRIAQKCERPVYQRECAECGRAFATTRKYQICCSPECTKHRQNRKPDRRLTKYGLKENGITLKKLYSRDGGTCYICGRTCDWNDKETRPDGTIIAGNRYPSIEHIVPISAGGQNNWENVMLACRECNTRKGNVSFIKIYSDGRIGLNI